MHVCVDSYFFETLSLAFEDFPPYAVGLLGIQKGEMRDKNLK